MNVGGQGTDVDWKVRSSCISCCTFNEPAYHNVQCEADLPEALRFGRVEVSCEGWSGPGDEFVLKGQFQATRIHPLKDYETNSMK